MSDGRKLAFQHYENRCLGYEYPVEVGEEYLSEKIKNYILQAFPGREITRIIIGSERLNPSMPAYRVWIDDTYLLLFDKEGEWTLVSGEFDRTVVEENGELLFSGVAANCD